MSGTGEIGGAADAVPAAEASGTDTPEPRAVTKPRLLLYPTGAITELAAAMQEEIRGMVGNGPCKIVRVPHLSLASFHWRADIGALRARVGTWAAAIPPLRLRVERLARYEGATLRGAEGDARERIIVLTVTGMNELWTARQAIYGPRTRPRHHLRARRWSPHITLLHGRHLPPEVWDELERWAEGREFPSAFCTVRSATLRCLNPERDTWDFMLSGDLTDEQAA